MTRWRYTPVTCRRSSAGLHELECVFSRVPFPPAVSTVEPPMRRLHSRQSIMLGIAAALLFLGGTSRNAAAQRVPDAELMQLSFTADGNWLAAAYYYHATNRPGTNWAAWTVLWNT